MRQIWITAFGAPHVLQVKDAPDPTPEPGEVRIRVAAAGVNFADIMGRMGLYPDLPPVPVVPGYEVSGTIDAVGAGVEPDMVGQEVFALARFGGYSDVVCVPVRQVFSRPEGMSAQEAAALPVAYLTAWQLVVVMGGLKRGETVLIHSAGGGVGLAATQISKALGATVIGTASQSKHSFLKNAGVDHLIDSRKEDFEKRAMAITNGRGVELILDPIGGVSFKKGFRALAPTGRLGMFGASSLATGRTRNPLALLSLIWNMPWVQFNPSVLIDVNKGVFGVNIGHMWSESERIRVWMGFILDLYAKGLIKPQIARSFKFTEAAQAHDYIQSRSNIGKVLLIP